MEGTLLSLLAGLVSGAITAVVTYFATLSKSRLDLAIVYDKELRENRLEAYKELWRRLKPLARYSPEAAATYQIVKDTSESMRDWYFDLGGIFLSRESREPYFALKRTMQAIIDDPDLQKEKERALEDPWIEPLLEQGRVLREALSNDIGSRQLPFLR
jgi:hypothetical protein